MDRLDALGTTIGGKSVQSLGFGYDRVGNVGVDHRRRPREAARSPRPAPSATTISTASGTAKGRRESGRTTSTASGTGRRSRASGSYGYAWHEASPADDGRARRLRLRRGWSAHEAAGLDPDVRRQGPPRDRDDGRRDGRDVPPRLQRRRRRQGDERPARSPPHRLRRQARRGARRRAGGLRFRRGPPDRAHRRRDAQVSDARQWDGSGPAGGGYDRDVRSRLRRGLRLRSPEGPASPVELRRARAWLASSST